MKRIFIGFAVIGLLLSPSLVEAQAIPTVKVGTTPEFEIPVAIGDVDFTIEEKTTAEAKVALMQGREIMKLFYINPNKERVVISIFDDNGKRLVNQAVRSMEGFIQPFNFTQLDEGDYLFEITDSEGTVVENLNFDRFEKQVSSVYKLQDSKKFKLSVFAENETVTVRITDVNLNLLFEEKLEDMDSFTRIYDLSDYRGSGVYFQVKTRTEEDVHYSEIK